MIVGVQLSSGNSAPNSANNQHLTIPFEGGMHIFKRQGACVSRNWRYESEPPSKPSPLTCYKQFGTNSIIVLMFVESQGCTYRALVRYVTKTWSVVLLNKKCIYSYLKCIVYDKLLKPQQSFWITLYIIISSAFIRMFLWSAFGSPQNNESTQYLPKMWFMQEDS